jgi:polyhydroxyalkanoate synthase
MARASLVDLKSIKVPMLHALAQYDYVVPRPEFEDSLVERVSSEDQGGVILPRGHVRLVAGPNAIKRMWPKLDQ